MRFPALLSIAILLSVTFAPTIGTAQPRERQGRAAFERGAAAFEEGQYAAALAGFQDAYSLTERPALLYNIGLAQDRLRMDAEALQSFERYMEAVPDTRFAEQVTSRISALRAAEERRAAERVALEQARTDAEAAEQVAASEAARRAVDAERAEEEARASREAASEAEAGRLEAEQRASRNRPSRWWIGVIVGVVVVGAGVGLAVGLSGRDEGFGQSDFGEVTHTLGSF